MKHNVHLGHDEMNKNSTNTQSYTVNDLRPGKDEYAEKKK